MKLLVVSPHADDETIGCGGVMRHVISKGGSAHVVVATLGETFFHHAGRVVSADEREEELAAAADVGGWKVEDVLFRDRELRLDGLERIALVEPLERIVIELCPHVVLIPYPSFHQDHKAVFDAMMTVLRPGPAHSSVRMVAMYEDPRVAWSHIDLRASFMYVDIGRHLTQKLAAFSQYRSQCEDGPWRVYSAKGLERWAHVRGAEVNMAAAEKFYVLRQIVDDSGNGWG